MSGLAIHADPAGGPDWVARILAIAGIVLTIVGFVITMYQFRKAGPEITVVVKRATSSGKPVAAGFDDVVEVEVQNAGRLSARVREVGVWIWDQEPSQHGAEPGKYLKLESAHGGFPIEIPSTGFISAKMPDGIGVRFGMLVQGDAQLGSGKHYKSRRMPIAAPSGPPWVA